MVKKPITTKKIKKYFLLEKRLNMNILRLFIFSTIIFVAYNKPCLSNIQKNNSANKKKEVKVEDSNSPTKIKSKTIKVKRKSGIIEFNDNAVIEKDDSSILADKMVVFYEEQKTDKSANLKKVEAIGNVKIFNQEFTVTGKKGIYTPSDDSLVIQDDVILNDGTSVAHGQKFLYNLKTKKGLLDGVNSNENSKNLPKKAGNGRVTVIINEGAK